MITLNTFLAGAIVVASWAIALFFLRFQKATADRLFGWFAVAFILFGLERVCLVFLPEKVQSYVYLIRLAAFLLIVFAILDKNRKEKE